MSLFVSKEQRNEAKWTKRDKKREIKCKKSRKRKKGLTKRVKSDKINKSPRESDKGISETKVKGSGEQKRPKE